MSTVMGCGWILIPFIAPFFTYTLKMSAADIGLFYLYAGAAVVCTNFAMSFLVAKWSAQRLLIAVIAIAVPLQLLLTHLSIGYVAFATLIAAIFYGCSVARWSLCNQLMTTHIKPEMRGGMMSLSFALQECAGGLVVTLGGTLMTMEHGALAGYARLGWISLAFNVVLIYLIVLMARENTQISNESVAQQPAP